MPPRLPAAHPRHEAPSGRPAAQPTSGRTPDVPLIVLTAWTTSPSTHERSMLEEGAALHDFLAEGMPTLLTEWHARRDNLPRDP
jgi:hypothetical protein